MPMQESHRAALYSSELAEAPLSEQSLNRPKGNQSSMTQDDTSERLVDIRDLTVAYGKRVALDNVTLAIEPGVVGLLGPNGAGKSTLLRTLLGFIRPANGSASVFGMPVTGNALRIRQRIGYMPEKDITSPKISAVAFVSYCGSLAGMPRADAIQRAHEVLNYVGLDEERYRTMETFSAGMLQRAKLAQALIHDPRLLFLDEPTNGLDPLGRVEMLDLITEIAKIKQVAIILSSHLLPDIEHVCERVVVINHGRIVRTGDMTDLTRMKGRMMEVRVREGHGTFADYLRKHEFNVQETHDGTLIVTHGESVTVEGLYGLARETGHQIRHVSPVRQKLEEVFLEAIQDTAAPA
jgi:ABC-2 type transport system ATP-binding protein